VLKPTDLPTIVVSNISLEANNVIKVNKSGTVNLSVAGCPAFSTPSWLVTDPTGVLSTTAYTGNSIVLTGFLKTDDFTIKVKCVSSSPACESNYSATYTVKVFDSNCDVTIDNYKGDASNPAKTSANGNITLNASGCSNGIIAWYLGGTKLIEGNSVVVNKPIGTYTFVANCSKGGTCTDQTTIEFSCAGPPVLSYYAPTTKVCEGQSIQLRATGCTGGTIAWNNPNGTYLGAGEFLTTALPKVNATCTIGSCSASSSIETQTALDLGLLTIFPNCDMNELTVTPDATGNTYEWKKNNDIISTAKTNKLTFTGVGTYSVTVKNGACSKATSYGVNNLNKLVPTVSVANPTVNCNNNSTTKTYNLTSTISQITAFAPTNVYTNWRINGDQYWTFVNGVKTLVTSPNCLSRVYGNTYEADKYELFVTNEYKYANNTKTLTCEASSSVNVINVAIPTPTINSNASCFPANGFTTLTATNCAAGKINWFKDGFPITGTALNLSVNSVGSYSARCIGVNCLGPESNAILIADCTTPRCSSPFSDISGTNQVYNQTFTYANTPGAQIKYLQVTFDAYCVPDNLIIYKVTANGESVLVNSGCMGSGIIGSTNNVRSKTFTPFTLAPGDVIRVTVGPVPCGSSNCQDAVTAWKVSFDCVPAN
jgi:hypothetical protein